ncbi:calcium-translocating P-type ATPase, PMCA-type [Firmicutes bacterium M10-2]|nr:calcium-translocating P-type ATPase, PMCA-type [Firmicutes bacterium M10-2]
MKYYDQSVQAVEKELDTNIHSGLDEAQVKIRQEKYGLNKLKEAKKKSVFMRFIDQFKDPMIIILLIAALISFVIAAIEQDPQEFFEPILILVIVILNAIMGVAQESKAEAALDALKKMSTPQARVIRDRKDVLVESKDLVPGDIIKLEAGDYVPADARLFQSVSLKCEEAALTGESVPAEKDAQAIVKDNAPLGDRIDMVYSGCSVTYGTGRAIVCATGMETEMGKIAGLLNNEENSQTPLQQKLAQLGKYLGFLAIGCCVIIFIVGMINGLAPLELFLTSVSLAVAAIPEGLPAIVTIVLSIGVTKLAKKNAIIRNLPAVETLGSASVICSDKTGTLTQNKMTLVKAWSNGQDDVMDITSDDPEEIKELLKLGTLCSDGSIAIIDGQEKSIGDPTETSIIAAAMKNGMTKEQLNEKYPRVAELPFDSDRKLMSTINKMNNHLVVITKGALDSMIPRLKSGDIEKAKKLNEEMSENALRVLAIAEKEINEIPKNLDSETLEKDLSLKGLVAMIDPARPEAKEAVKVCKKAGIRPVMITGDHVITASAIAKELGILNPGDKAITGVELDAMSDDELDRDIENISVYARVSPENKIRIVKGWQRKNQVVAMTGDGVNDAPALKAADIGCAMGITGTEVAKGAADLILTDDNFATIVFAVKEGRGIYANLKKVIGYLLGTNIGEVLTVFVSMLLWHTSPLVSMQLLWINLVTDSLPAIALGMEPVENDVMDHKPKRKSEGIFAHGFGARIILQGFMFGGLAILSFYLGRQLIHTVRGAETMTFITLALSQVVQAFNMRSEHSLFKIGFFTNKRLNLAAFVSVLLVALVVFTPLNIPFNLEILPWNCFFIALGLALVPFVVMECSKAFGLIKHHH